MKRFDLCLDTSGRIFYLSIREVEGLNPIVLTEINSRESERDSFPSLFLSSLISETLKNSIIDLTDINKFYLGTGPGSFTGLRIGASYLQGISFALDKPIIGIPSFYGMLFNAQECLLKEGKDIKKLSVSILRPAGRGEYYYQEFKDSKAGTLSIVSFDRLEQIIIGYKETGQPYKFVVRYDEFEEVISALRIKFKADILNEFELNSITIKNFSSELSKAVGLVEPTTNNQDEIKLIYTREISAKKIMER